VACRGVEKKKKKREKAQREFSEGAQDVRRCLESSEKGKSESVLTRGETNGSGEKKRTITN
jgi:hypothetical protein